VLIANQVTLINAQVLTVVKRKGKEKTINEEKSYMRNESSYSNLAKRMLALFLHIVQQEFLLL